MNANELFRRVDLAFDQMLKKLGCVDGNDSIIISHWQDDILGYRLQVTRKTDGRSLTRGVRPDGTFTA